MSDANQPSGGGSPAPEQPSFDPEAGHMTRPRLRPVRGFMAQHEGRSVLGLADAQQVSERVVFTAPQAQSILPMLDGKRDLDQIVSEVGRGLTRPMLEQFVAQLDGAGLIEGPTFESMLEKLKSDYDSADRLPPSVTAAAADALVVQEVGEDAADEQKKEQGPAALSKKFDEWIDQALKDAQDPSFDRLPDAVFVPSVDYALSWPNYAAVYGRMRVVDRPDRVVVLGSSTTGRSTGVCGCDKGYETPLGVSPLAEDLFGALKKGLGEDGSARLLKERYDHERAHAIEAQVAWLQHVFGNGETQVPVFGALVHDPLRNGGASYDGEGLALTPFVDGLRAAMGEVGGRTLVVCAADLAHVGPQFGDRQALVGDDESAQAFRNQVLQHDRQMLEMIAKNKPQELLNALTWQQNRMRWTSVGALVAAMELCEGTEVRMLNYYAATDPKGAALVSTFAGAAL